MSKWLLFGVASLFGAWARFFISAQIFQRFGSTFPYGTLLVNVSGCLIVGVFNSLAETKMYFGANDRLILITGFCGAYTTFSSFILQTSNLIDEGAIWRAATNVLSSLVFGYLFFRVGAFIGRAI